MTVQKIGQYELVRTIKESPRGSVSLVEAADGTRYILRRFCGSSGAYRKLLRVESPFLPKIYAAEEDDGQVTILEEYIDGLRLSDRLNAGTLSTSEARGLMYQLCKAVRTLHQRDIVHRDIKPDNIILRAGVAVLVDFDAARLYEPGSVTDTQVLGTVGYAAPEQFGIYQSDKRTDIYALGVLLNVMLTGNHPAVGQLASGSMRRIIQRCTMMSPKDRYQSASQLMSALRCSGWLIPLLSAAAFAGILAAALLMLAPEQTPPDQTPPVTTATPTTTPAPTPTPPPTPTPTPENLPRGTSIDDAIPYEYVESFAVDTWVELPWTAAYTRRNGTPGEGVTFTGLYVVRTEDDAMDFTIEFEAEQSFYCAAFDPTSDLWRTKVGDVQAGQTSLRFSIPLEALNGLTEITVAFSNESGRKGDTEQEWNDSQNTNLLSIPGYVLNKIRQ